MIERVKKGVKGLKGEKGVKGLKGEKGFPSARVSIANATAPSMPGKIHRRRTIESCP